MKIAYISADLGVPVLGYKGASIHMREFAHALMSLGHTVQIISASASDALVVESEARDHTTTSLPLTVVAPTNETRLAAQRLTGAFLRLGWRRDPQHFESEARHILADDEFVVRALPLLREFAPDLLIARHALFSLAGVELASELGCPCALEVNAPLIEERRRYWGLSFDQQADAAERNAFRRADLLIAISEGVRAYLLRHDADADRVVVTPNGVNLEQFHPGIDGSFVRQRYGLENSLVIGFAGSLKPWHGVELLVQTFADLLATLTQLPERSEEPAVTPYLLIMGDGPQRESLLQQSRRLGVEDRVLFTGAIPHHEVPSHLAALDIAVAPYRDSDGFYFSPLKIIEYMAVGTAIIAPQIGQIPSLIGMEQDACGLLYHPDDRSGLANALFKLSHDGVLRRQLGAAGAIRGQRHDWREIARQLVDRLASIRALAQT